MLTCYIASYPETAFSLLKKGCLPSALTDGSTSGRLLAYQNHKLCLASSNRVFQETFIIEIVVPKSPQHYKRVGKKSDPDQAIALSGNAFDPKWISRVILYDQASRERLDLLFIKDKINKPVVIRPSFFPNAKLEEDPPVSKLKRAAAEDREDSRSKSYRTDADSASLYSREDSLMNVRRLSTESEHVKCLKDAFDRAKKSILITSYGMNHDTFFALGLYNLIKIAGKKGVRIYIYTNDKTEQDPLLRKFLERQEHVLYGTAYTHSKILAVDGEFVAVGSFNWLSALDKRYPPSLNASLLVSAQSCPALFDRVWDFIRHYRHLQFNNIKQLSRFDEHGKKRDWVIDRSSCLTYLATLSEHCSFLFSCFQQAKKSIVICAPFISEFGNFMDEIDPDMLKEASDRGVKICFVGQMQNAGFDAFADFLSDLNLPTVYLVAAEDIHLKTIIVDDSLISEGSFNWLSATRDETSAHHNHEVSLVLQGKASEHLILDFFETNLGRAVSRSFSQNRTPLSSASSSSSFFALGAGVVPQSAVAASHAGKHRNGKALLPAPGPRR